MSINYPLEYMGYRIGDEVIKIGEHNDSYRMEYDTVYKITRFKMTNSQKVCVVGPGCRVGWWVHHEIIAHANDELCRRCSNTCRVKGTEKCGFFEEKT
jgi:hypothetical protein